MKTFEQLFAVNKIIPVVTIENSEMAIPLAKTLLTAGINTMEITLRTPNALEIIELLAHKVPELLVAAGTILTAAAYYDSCIAGARYILSPGVTDELLVAARSRYNNVRFVPGVVTPSHAMKCASHGFNHLKFFPAEAYNAYEILKAVADPLPEIKFCPTGGITLANMEKYLQLPNVFAIGMSSIVDSKLIAAGNLAEIGRRCQEAVAIVNNVLKK